MQALDSHGPLDERLARTGPLPPPAALGTPLEEIDTPALLLTWRPSTATSATWPSGWPAPACPTSHVAGYKKAYVTLAEGDKIEFFEGV